MKTMKKVLALTLACLMLASLSVVFSACGGKGDYTAIPTSDEESSDRALLS